MSQRIAGSLQLHNNSEVAGLTSPTARIWLADPLDHDRLMPVGAVAELLLEGPGLAERYLDDSAKTAQRFIESPRWLSGSGRRVYKTGDLVQHCVDGSFRYVARKDFQVKIRGMRVDLTELEHCVSQHCPSITRPVAEAVVPDTSDGAPILAMFLHYADDFVDDNSKVENEALFEAPDGWRTQFQLDVEHLNTVLTQSLPKHMIPTIYLPLRHLPLTTSKKIDRRRIRETICNLSWLQLQMCAMQRIERIPPRTDAEIVLHSLFAQVLNIKPHTFGVLDSFLHHGGDSLTAMRLVHLCRQYNLPSISFQDVMEHQTIREILMAHDDSASERSLSLSKEWEFTADVKIDHHLEKIIAERLRQFGLPENTEVEGVFPCSYVQEGILISQARHPSHYQICSTYTLKSTAHEIKSLDLCRLKHAWKQLIKTHPMLRTIFVESTVSGLFALQVILSENVCESSIMQCDTNPREPDFWRGKDSQFTEPMWPSLPRLNLTQDNTGSFLMTLSISHAITDASSMLILMRDLKQIYSKRTEGEVSHAATRLLYSEYVMYLRQSMSPFALEFWSSYLAGVEPCLFSLMGTICQRKEKPPSWQRLPIQLENTSSYQRFCSFTGITLATVFKLAWALVLRSFTASNKVCFGYVTSGRDLPLAGIENAFGPFINTLPCFVNISSDKSVSKLLQELQAEFTKAVPHQRVSLAAIQNSLNLDGNDTLFNTSISFTPPMDDEETSQIRITEVNRWDPMESDILVEVTSKDNNVSAELKYWTSILSASQASNVADTLSRILLQILETPEKKPCELNLISSQDEACIDHLNSMAPPSSEVSVQTLIDQQFMKDPKAKAVHSWDGDLTYGDIHELSAALASELLRRGVKQNVYVPLCLSRSYWTPVAMLAVMKTGAAFCLLDVSQPQQRLREICDQLQPHLIITCTEHAELAERLGAQETLCIDVKRKVDLAPSHDPDVQIRIEPNNALYVVFTSGSTGKPKGIIIEHRSFATNAYEHARILGLSNTSRMLQISGYAFDIAVLEHLTVLLAGGCICIPSELERLSHPAGAVDRMGVDIILTTPSVARVFNPLELPSLKVLALCGESMNETDIERWTPNVRLANVYGPAECTVISTIQQSQKDRHPQNIGWPIACCAWITMPNDPRQLLPIGAVGELLIEGEIVGRGYISDELAGNFIQPPAWLRAFRRELCRPGKSLYRTGDLVCYDTNDHSLQYVGRVDTQIKLHGQRIEVSEVEHHVRSHFPRVRGVIVDMVRREQAAALVAFIMTDMAKSSEPLQDSIETVLARPDEDFQCASTMTINNLQQNLPSYMIPSVFVPLLELPLTKTGKANRRRLVHEMTRLPDELFLALKGGKSRVKKAPSTDQEIHLQHIWATTLNIPSEQIGIEDRFFSLGGDSISAIQAVARCRSLGLLISAADMMRNPTIGDLSPRIEAIVKEDHAECMIVPFSLMGVNYDRNYISNSVERLCGIEPGLVEDVYPCTSLQEGLIALTAKTSDAYVAEWIFKLPANIELARLDAAWKKVFAANPILRTRIIQLPDDEKCYQAVIQEEGSWTVCHGAESYTTTMKHQLGLNKPLVQLVVIIAESQSHLILRLHHAAYDGWSLPLLLEQVQQAYEGKRLVSCSMTPFIEYVQKQHIHASQWWKAELEDVTMTVFPPLPTGSFQPAPDSIANRSINIGHLASNNYSLATNLHLTCALVISQYTGSHDVIFGITTSGRTAPVAGIERLTGPTNVTLPQRIALVPQRTVREVLQRIQDRNASVVPYEQFGMQNIAKCGESHATACAFQTLLIIQPPRKEFGGALFSEGASMTALTAFTGYSLMLECQLFNDTIEILASFDSEAISRSQVTHLLRQFDHVLGQISDPSALGLQLTALNLTHPEDAAQLTSWNFREESILQEISVKHAIQEQCNMQPEAQAVSAWDGDFTYGELDQLSHRLANHLRACGVRPEIVVPIYSEKSRWVTVAILAIIKAGGAFVLLEPSYPSQRLRQICHLASAQLVVASQDYTSSALDLVEDGTVITVGDNSWPDWNYKKPMENETSQVAEDANLQNLLYVVFTSGSTGESKGAMIENQSCHISATGLHRHTGMDKRSRILQFSSHAFDISVWDHIGTLLAGGCVCIPSETQRRNCLAQATTAMRANIAILTPSVARTLGGPDAVPTLRTLVLAGELISREDITTWHSKLRLINGYGPAECAGITTFHTIDRDDDDPRNVGRPNDGFSIWITHPDDVNQLSPVGAVGEVVVEGPVVARGYLNDAKRSDAVFVPDPLWLRHLPAVSTVSGRRFYKTGDMGQYQSDGTILFLGRRDGQLKIRGQRVDLSEVEYHVSQQFKGAPEVFAFAVEQGRRQILVCLVVWQDQNGTDNDAVKAQSKFFAEENCQSFRDSLPSVRGQLGRILPPYMIPNTFIPLARVPLTFSGKVDRRLLHQHVSNLSKTELEAFEASERLYRAPTSRPEQVLQSVFASVLGIHPQSVSADDNFFKIGGDSLTAMRVVSLARQEGLSFSVGDILQSPVLSALARVDKTTDLASQQVSTSPYVEGSLLGVVDIEEFASTLTTIPVRFTPKDIADILPATAFQANCVEGGHILYHWLQLPESVDLSRLDTACHALVQQNSIFRTLFILHHAQYLQVVLRNPHFNITKVTCEENIDNFIESMCHRDSVQAKTTGEPLFQMYLISQSMTEHRRLVIRLTHAQYDGTSLGHALKELSVAYDGHALDTSIPSFAQYLHYKKLVPSSGTRHFWQDYLSGASMTDLTPAVSGQPNNTDGETISAEREISLGSNEEGIPIAFLAQATWAVILAQLSGDRDIVFGFVFQNRNAPLPNMEHVSGPCSNIVPTRITIDPTWTASQLVKHVKDQYIRVVSHATMDLKEIQPLVPQWSPSTRFGSVFNYINMSILSAPRLEGIECQQGVISPGGAAKFLRGYSKFLVRITLRNDKLRVYMSGWEVDMTSEFVNDLVGRFVATITEFSRDYSRPLGI